MAARQKEQKTTKTQVKTDMLALLGNAQAVFSFDRNVVRVFSPDKKYIGLFCWTVDTQYNGDKELVISHVIGHIPNFAYIIEDDIVNMAKKLKCKYIRLHTDFDNKIMQRIYKRLKFLGSEIIYRRFINEQ